MQISRRRLRAFSSLFSFWTPAIPAKSFLGRVSRWRGATSGGVPVRHYTGRIFATSVSLVLDLPIYDTQCGAKMFRCSETTSVLFKDPFVSRWIFDVEIVARLLQERGPEAFRGTRSVLVEFPLQEWEDVSGSKIRTTDFPKALLDLWRIRSHYRLR